MLAAEVKRIVSTDGDQEWDAKFYLGSKLENSGGSVSRFAKIYLGDEVIDGPGGFQIIRLQAAPRSSDTHEAKWPFPTDQVTGEKKGKLFVPALVSAGQTLYVYYSV